MLSQSVLPSVINFVPGPMEPATKRGRSLVACLSHAARAICAPSLFNSRVHATISGSKSAPTSLLDPNVSVSTTSAPAKRKVS